MTEKLTPQTRAVLELAREEARRLQHEYVGTEHLLLGLIAEETGVAASVLRARGLDYSAIHREIELLVQVGPTPVATRELPLTPRALQAIQFAEEDARMVGQSLVDTEHLLTGLLREAEGVAGMILRKRGLNINEIGAEVFKIRLLQMKIVERVVRPVRASIARKRRMRDEMLTHLSAIYDDELARSAEPMKSVEAAARRFGDPAELTVELQASVPRLEQWEMRLEPIFGWRAPETVVRWMTRVALQMGAVMLLACALAAVLALNEFGWSYSVWLTVRPIAAAALVLPISVAMTGICYYKVRDHVFGVFGSRKSWNQAIAWASVIACTTVACGFVFITVAYGSLATAQSLVYPFLAAGILWALSTFFAVKKFGPLEIRDTTWALLDLDDQPLAA